MSGPLTLPQLRDVLVAAAGATEEMADVEDIGNHPFTDLGYDSLALMESASQLQRQYGVVIPEEKLGDFETPNELLAYVNDLAAAAR
jgi:act minimal PKS acyl carrier protein